jgi:hypothetical protein
MFSKQSEGQLGSLAKYPSSGLKFHRYENNSGVNALRLSFVYDFSVK